MIMNTLSCTGMTGGGVHLRARHPGRERHGDVRGSGPAAPFPARGLESNDSYSIAGSSITVSMGVTEPGDWIRVITRVPEPTSLAPVGAGFAGACRRRA